MCCFCMDYCCCCCCYCYVVLLFLLLTFLKLWYQWDVSATEIYCVGLSCPYLHSTAMKYYGRACTMIYYWYFIQIGFIDFNWPYKFYLPKMNLNGRLTVIFLCLHTGIQYFVRLPLDCCVVSTIMKHTVVLKGLFVSCFLFY